ncbi:MAG: hypothetical protein ACREFR_10985 [Limisphaerales bacterium]
MPDILIRDVPEKVVAELAHDAERNRRSREKHALFLIESALRSRPADTCGEMLEYIEKAPPPKVDRHLLEIVTKERGRRSGRP